MDDENRRDCCLFYRSYIEAGEMLGDPEKELKFYKDIFRYGTEQIEPEYDEPLLKMAWTFCKPLIDANIRNYLNGKKGGAPKGNSNARKNNPKQPKNNPKQPVVEKKQGNKNVTVNVNAKENANDNDNVTLSSFDSPPFTRELSRKKKRLEDLEDGEWI